MRAHYLLQIIYMPEGDGPQQGIQKVIDPQLLSQYDGPETDLVASVAIQAFIELEKGRARA